MLKYDDFLLSIEQESEAPENLSITLKALWYEGKGDWSTAHGLIDHLQDRESARVHAYLHRVEGDLWNAKYWYNQAHAKEFHGELKDEWIYLVKLFL